MENKLLEAEIVKLSDFFPKLRSRFIQSGFLVLEGDIDICDTIGNWWDTFRVIVFIPNTYPHCIPIVFELSEKIPREIDRHISTKGQCCIDIPHRLLHMQSIGINLTQFFKDKIYSFFTNQLYFEKTKYFAKKEFKHGFDGVVQFYNEDLKLFDPDLIVHILDKILRGKVFPKDFTISIPCICDSNIEYKKCHKSTIDFLASLPKERLFSDLIIFIKYTKKPLLL